MIQNPTQYSCDNALPWIWVVLQSHVSASAVRRDFNFNFTERDNNPNTCMPGPCVRQQMTTNTAGIVLLTPWPF